LNVGVHSNKNSKHQPKTFGVIRVKRNLFEQPDKQANNDNDSGDQTKNSLIYNKKSMDIYVKTSKDSEMSSRASTPLLIENQNQDQPFENIVCSPTLMYPQLQLDATDHLDEFDVDDDDDDLFIEEANNDTLYNMITQKLGNCESFSAGDDNDSEIKRNLMIASVGSLNNHYNTKEMTQNNSDAGGNEVKVAIGGLYLRNTRGNQVRQYDVNSLYSALQDVKNGHSIYRSAQTYNIPRKTLRNWMKRLHIKSQFPMPKQLKEAAIRKKNSQVKEVRSPSIMMNSIEAIELS